MDQASAQRQPLLHDEVVVIAAPTQVWSARDGSLGAMPVHGIYHGDTRVVRESVISIEGQRPEPIGHAVTASSATFHAIARGVDDTTPDPKVRLEHRRDITPGQVSEHITLSTALPVPLDVTVALHLTLDASDMQVVKAGSAPVHPTDVVVDAAAVTANANGTSIRCTAPNGAIVRAADQITISWRVHVPARGTASVHALIETASQRAVVCGFEGPRPFATLPPTGNPELDAWSHTAQADLAGLVLATPGHETDPFFAAGTPWFVTLFGRDSLIAARLTLPLGTRVAHGTLRTLARMQGTRVDPSNAEQPGKILHEIRHGSLSMPGEDIHLPPVYFGTVDATGLWIILLHDAWRAGLSLDAVRELQPNLEAALSWMRDYGDPTGTGFLHYIDESGSGLSNQGWKDSGDSIRFRDGSIAKGPIALCEVQAQAFEAAMGGAALLDALGYDGDEWRAWASALRQRFHDAFWVERDGHRFPAIALDGTGTPVDSRTSNMGQLIGTGILDRDDERAIAHQLIDATFASGWGLRTMASDEAAYWPLSYHCGSVWPHDTGVIVAGMLRAGLQAEARLLAGQLVAAATAFQGRMPELYAGDAGVVPPAPYPAACRPQAWSAAAVVPVVAALAS